MRRFFIGPALAIALIAPTSAASPTSPSAPPKCPFERTRDSNKAVFHRLGELPPANQYLAVYRMIDGCKADVILARGIGANGHRTEAPRR